VTLQGVLEPPSAHKEGKVKAAWGTQMQSSSQLLARAGDPIGVFSGFPHNSSANAAYANGGSGLETRLCSYLRATAKVIAN
jgi:hypothetical protein